MPTYIRGRSQRIQRRREIIARLMEICRRFSTLLRSDEPIKFEETQGLEHEHTKLLLELTELNAIDDQKISVRKS